MPFPGIVSSLFFIINYFLFYSPLSPAQRLRKPPIPSRPFAPEKQPYAQKTGKPGHPATFAARHTLRLARFQAISHRDESP